VLICINKSKSTKIGIKKWHKTIDGLLNKLLFYFEKRSHCLQINDYLKILIMSQSL